MKILVTINEALEEMALGRNTTLAYILAAIELGHEVYIHNLPTKPQKGEVFPTDRNAAVPAVFLNKNPALCQALLEQYKKSNDQLTEAIAGVDHEGLAKLEKPKVSKFSSQNTLELPQIESISLNEIGSVLQRLEPMKAPFPPQGLESFDETLKQMKSAFPRLVFNCPIGLGDKETPQEINRLLQENDQEVIATPTTEFRLGDDNFSSALAPMFAEYHKLFADKVHGKIVLKPKNSAQSCGVCAMEISGEGMDLATLKGKTIDELSKIQIYKIKPSVEGEELKQVVEIMCYVERLKTDSSLITNVAVGTIARDEIQRSAKELYNEEILAQPFLEGVKQGDIRANILKNGEGNFYLAGYTYRKSQRSEGADFTTCYTSGAATSAPISELTKTEQEDLHQKTKKLLEFLNGDLKEKYKNSTELGVDFIPVGNGKVLLGEINHTCPALLPISEAIFEAMKRREEDVEVMSKSNYDGGLGYAKKGIEDTISLQKPPASISSYLLSSALATTSAMSLC